MWDAAYVLGSLSAADRREFEAHLASCPACREAVGELSGMPAVLSQLDRDEVAAIGDADQASPEVSPELLSSLLATVRLRRRRARLLAWTCSAAAAVALAIGVLVGVAGYSATSPPPQTSVSALPMAQVGTTMLASTVSVSSQRWGTFITMKCVCLAPVYAHHDRLAMAVVGRDGSQTRLATWVAEPGHTATPAASISTPVDQIAAVQVVSADNGKVLLERTL
ncbi:zf-HC2 domain-containing protein [Mycobacterium sp. SM1]|uniref:anti-sigma factor family protein n=1 Tax=Mycobacterium sp. SM1 TaxID=2816243 RepID=UPI001BCD471A|nr:zf-HC2 domain-containing protein [Mycobacterium sp. SM1]MBS4728829.1 zf-HC2 domain-containing protein [Mycobacterium sp. SM1]